MKYLFLVFISSAVAAGLRGVASQDLGKYEPDAEGFFHCLSDPSVKIPISQINDDYCDCPDGSDEPGTAACANGRFYCHNKGHIPGFIPSRLIDDGVCDYSVCCDGSDESSGKCPSKCKEIHKAYQERKEAERKLLERGLLAREPLVREAQSRRKSLQDSVEQGKHALSSIEKELEYSRQALREIEANSGGEREINALAVSLAKTAKESIQNVVSEAKALQEQLEKSQGTRARLDSILDTLRQDYNPNFNDPAVKLAIRNWEEIIANDETSDEPAFKVDGDTAGQLSSLVDQLAEQTVPGVAQSSPFDALERWAVSHLQKYHILPPTVAPGETVNHAVEAAQSKVSKLEAEATQKADQISLDQTSLDKVYGPDDVFRAMENVCVKNKYGEYDYEVCFFGAARQVGHGQSTILGHYEGVSQRHDKLFINYENGARCWNGPIRRADIVLSCGDQNEIISVTEAEKCIYDIKMRSPAACIPQGGHSGSENHDDL